MGPLPLVAVFVLAVTWILHAQSGWARFFRDHARLVRAARTEVDETIRKVDAPGSSPSRGVDRVERRRPPLLPQEKKTWIGEVANIDGSTMQLLWSGCAPHHERRQDQLRRSRGSRPICCRPGAPGGAGAEQVASASPRGQRA